MALSLTNTHTYMHIHTQSRTHTCIYAYTRICICIHMHTRACTPEESWSDSNWEATVQKQGASTQDSYTRAHTHTHKCKHVDIQI